MTRRQDTPAGPAGDVPARPDEPEPEHPRPPGSVQAPARRWRLDGELTARLLAYASRVTGLLAIVSVVVPAARRQFRGTVAGMLDLPSAAGAAAAGLTLVAGVGLLMLGTGLRRGKRRAWGVAVVLTGALTVSHVVHELARQRGTAALVFSGLLLIALVVTRRRFTAVTDPIGVGWAVRRALMIAFAGFALNWLLLAVVSNRVLAGDYPQRAKALESALALIGVDGPVDLRMEWLSDLVAAVGLSFGVTALLALGYFLLRCAEPPHVLADDDERQVRVLLAGHGRRDSLGYFALRRDKLVVHSPTHKAAVSYRVLAGVALASGDPLGDVEAWPGAIDAFLDECRRHAWVPAVIGCSETGARVWRRHGLTVLELGDEAVVDTATFSLDGRPMRGVRQAVGRVRRAGYTVAVRRVRDIDRAELDELAGHVEKWRGEETERGYSMALSRFGDAADPDCVVVTASTDGAVRGLLQFVPWGFDGLSLDLMVRDRDAEGGLNELMIVELLAAGPGLGVVRVSLNFAMFRAALERGERLGAGPVARGWAKALRVASRWWQIESLYRFNEKFRPDWVPRYVAFPRVRDLPRIGLAALEAEGFGGRPPVLLRVLSRR